jgi:hypothetical protein
VLGIARCAPDPLSLSVSHCPEWLKDILWNWGCSAKPRPRQNFPAALASPWSGSPRWWAARAVGRREVGWMQLPAVVVADLFVVAGLAGAVLVERAATLDQRGLVEDERTAPPRQNLPHRLGRDEARTLIAPAGQARRAEKLSATALRPNPAQPARDGVGGARGWRRGRARLPTRQEPTRGPHGYFRGRVGSWS